MTLNESCNNSDSDSNDNDDIYKRCIYELNKYTAKEKGRTKRGQEVVKINNNNTTLQVIKY